MGNEDNFSNGTSFVVKNGLLYRKRQDEGRTVTQLAFHRRCKIRSYSWVMTVLREHMRQ